MLKHGTRSSAVLRSGLRCRRKLAPSNFVPAPIPYAPAASDFVRRLHTGATIGARATSSSTSLRSRWTAGRSGARFRRCGAAERRWSECCISWKRRRGIVNHRMLFVQSFCVSPNEALRALEKVTESGVGGGACAGGVHPGAAGISWPDGRQIEYRRYLRYGLPQQGPLVDLTSRLVKPNSRWITSSTSVLYVPCYDTTRRRLGEGI